MAKKLKIAKPIKVGKVPAPANHEALLERLGSYDKVVVGFSGGKDSIACVLRLLDLGVPAEKIRLWHHDVDGMGENFMDWPVTRAYCRAFAEAFGMELRFSWREGGFLAETLKENAQSRCVAFELEQLDDDGLPVVKVQASSKAAVSTRRMFPALGANLQTRWCSAMLKIDVMSYAMRNDPAYDHGRFLVVTGERRQESANRATYPEWDLHRVNSKARTTHVWRPVIDLKEEDVWNLMKAHGVRPHPAYELGFGRTSCMGCIFGNKDQWATVKDLAPQAFDKISGLEKEFGHTIRKGVSIEELAAQGVSTALEADPALRVVSQHEDYSMDDIIVPEGLWELPPGAFKECGGPT